VARQKDGELRSPGARRREAQGSEKRANQGYKREINFDTVTRRDFSLSKEATT